MNAVIAEKKPRAKRTRKSKLKFNPTGYALRDGRRVQLVPWIAQSPQPWREGYARIFIPYTELELRNAKNGKRGHEQIVRAGKLIRV